MHLVLSKKFTYIFFHHLANSKKTKTVVTNLKPQRMYPEEAFNLNR